MFIILTVAPHGNNHFTLRMDEPTRQYIADNLNHIDHIFISFENPNEEIEIMDAVQTFLGHGRLSAAQINNWINEHGFGHNPNLNELPTKLIFRYENGNFSLYPRQYHN